MADVPAAVLTKRHHAEGGSAVARWGAVAAYMAFIFALSAIPSPPSTPPGTDKVLHALLYAGLGLLVARALGSPGGASVRTVMQATLWGALYGMSDELHQYFNPPRAVEALDVVADTVGAALGGVGVYAWGIIRGRNGV